MKAFFTAALVAFSVSSYAADTTLSTESLTNDIQDDSVGTTSTQLGRVINTTKYNTTEAGMTYSSMNNGTAFINIGVVHEFTNGFALGVRGGLPMQYSRDNQLYSGEILGRFMLLNETNRMYIEPTITQFLFNDNTGTNPFMAIGSNFAFVRQINKDMSVGGLLGANYASTRVVRGVWQDTEAINSQFGVTGSYAF